jgi:cellulose synthase (UDP-forming)
MNPKKSPPQDHETLRVSQRFVVLVFLAVAVWYLSWRAGTLNPDALVFSWVIYAAELFGFATVLLHLFMTWRLKVRHSPDAPDGFKVAVFIPTFNESVDLVRNTLIAAMHMDYPHETWLLDDGNRPHMRDLADELGVRYLARTENIHAKAGNLNHALLHTDADFIAVFDADHAPQRHFLTRTLGYFQDENVAFVQTPQDFFNLDSYQHRWLPGRRSVWTEQALFFRVIQRGKDYWNAAFFCGSCAVVRREALDRIGGFATETVTEDLHTSIRLHKLGYRSVYHPESLAFGLAPASVVPFLKQRVRWGQGAMQVWRQEGVLTARGLSLPQRLNYFASMVTYFDGWQKGIFYLAPVVVLITGILPISAMGMEFFLHFIPYYLLSFWVFEEVGRGYGRSLLIEQYNMGRFAAFAWATLALFQRKLRFSVTPKGVSRARETYRFLIPQMTILGLNVLGLLAGLVLFMVMDGHLPVLALLVNSVWAAVNLSLALAVVLFTLGRAGQRRAEYRFPIPLPARVRFEGGPTLLVTVDDISSDGCRLYGPLPPDIGMGDSLAGVITLPSGNVAFRARTAALVRSEASGQPYIKAVGCEFRWESAAERDALKLFLYGSDLQWHLHSLREQSRTPLDWLAGLWRGGRTEESALDRWNAVTYRLPGMQGDDALGLVSLPQGHGRQRQILSFAPLPPRARLDGRITTRTEQTDFSATIGECRMVESPIAPLYLSSVTDFEPRDTWQHDLQAQESPHAAVA